MTDAPRKTIAARIRDLLKDGPATTAEVAASLDLGSHRAGSHLRLLWLRGKLDKAHFAPGGAMAFGRTRVFLWAVRGGLPANLKPEEVPKYVDGNHR